MLNRKTVFCWLVALGCMVGAVFIYRASVEARRKQRCQTNLTQIGIALHSYHAEYDSFPPAYVVGQDGQPMHSWRVLLLPFLGHKGLYAQYRLSEPWNSPHNRLLVEKMPPEYACESDQHREVGTTSYLAIVGPETTWPEQYVVKDVDIKDRPSATIQLVESAASQVIWTEPHDLLSNNATLDLGVKPNFSSKHGGGAHVLWADGRASFLSDQIDPEVLESLLTINSGLPLDGVEWPQGVSGDFPSVRDASELERTDVVPHMAGPILAGRNYVYCSTFQIAWDEFKEKFAEGPIQLEGAPPMAVELNRRPFDRSNLSPSNYLVVTAFAEDGIVDRIQSEISAKFPSARIRIPERTSESVAAICAYLQKNLPFRVRFQSLNDPLVFRTAARELEVESFGIDDYDPHGRTDDIMAEQVVINDYVSENDFVVTLRTTAGDDIILAKTSPRPSMTETVTAVLSRQIKGQGRLRRKETLIVPKMGLNVERNYRELIDRPLLNPSLNRMHLSVAWQSIRFLLNESGARLDSAAIVGALNGDPPVPDRPRRLVFDRPFLICLREKQASQPYLAIWVENDELLVRRR